MRPKAKAHLAERTTLVIAAHVDALDQIARDMESKWGVGRLPLLVDADLAARFKAQREVVNAAVWDSGDPEEVRLACAAMRRAWEYLDQMATANGARPLLPQFWEAVTDGGTVIVIAKDDPSAWEAVRQNRQAVVYTVEEVARLLASQSLVMKAKQAFPEGKVTATRVKAPNASLNDPIPF